MELAERRQAEARMRDRVARLVADLDLSAAAVARRLHITERTCRRWCAQTNLAAPLGRAPAVITRAERKPVLDALANDRLLGVPALCDRFPQLPRNALAELCARLRYAHACRARSGRRLTWLHPGTAWAIDATTWSGLALIVVRDLASGLTFVRAACAESAEQTVRILRQRFEDHGPPLILKRDNGGPFTAKIVDELLREYGVLPLTSPPYRPTYNAGVERGIGALKLLLPSSLEQDDPLQYALHHLNHRVRRRGRGGATAGELWDIRVAVHDFERQRLAEEVNARRQTLRQEALGQQERRRPKSDTTNTLSQSELARIERRAIADSLVGLQYLLIQRA